jgi:hypothetical protein
MPQSVSNPSLVFLNLKVFVLLPSGVVQYPRFISIPISTATINMPSLTTFTFPVSAFFMTISLLAVCSLEKNNFAAEGYMDLDNPSILN